MGIRPRGVPRAGIAMCMVTVVVIAASSCCIHPHYTSKPHQFVKHSGACTDAYTCVWVCCWVWLCEPDMLLWTCLRPSSWESCDTFWAISSS